MLYGKPTKHIRHSNEIDIVLEPQRFFIHSCWQYKSNAAARTDGKDIASANGAAMPLGSRVTKHKFEILVTPETIEPQQIYMGRIKLSFHDVYASAVMGGRIHMDSYGGTGTAFVEETTEPISLHLFPDDRDTGVTIQVEGSNIANQLIGGTGSTKGITDLKLDDHIHHFLSLKKITVFDQRPLMGERNQKIPSKVKRINEGTFYGIFFFNDSPRGGTPADTQVKINIKEYIEEMAI